MVKNIGDQSQSYFGVNQKLIDASGRQYAADTTADVWMNTGNNPLGAINPGNWIQVRIAFDVAPGTQVGELELHDSMLSGGVSVRWCRGNEKGDHRPRSPRDRPDRSAGRFG